MRNYAATCSTKLVNDVIKIQIVIHNIEYLAEVIDKKALAIKPLDYSVIV